MTLENKINEIWLNQDNNAYCLKNKDMIISAIREGFATLDSGEHAIAEKVGATWNINVWLKQVLVLHMKFQNDSSKGLNDAELSFGNITNKFKNWSFEQIMTQRIGMAPETSVRYGVFINKGVILLPSFINVGAYIDSGTLIDSYVTIGSCARIGRNCHISAHTVIGGVLEPLQANPVIIEDDCFIGANCSIVEGVIVKQNSVISSGLHLTASTKIYNPLTKEISYKVIPENSVVVAGLIPSDKTDYQTLGAIIVKQKDEKTASKTAINEDVRIKE